MSYSDPVPHEKAVAIVNALTSVPGVAGMHAGRFGEIALLFPGERVRGLRVDDGRLQVHVDVDLDQLGLESDLHQFAGKLRDLVTQKTNLPVDVTVADVA